MKSIVALFVAAIVASPVLAADPKPTKPDPTKGQQIASEVCGACHSFDGSRGTPANPILAGQHPEYLVKQLHDFKSGARASDIMSGFAATLSDQDVLDVAAFYASKSAKAGFAHDKATLQLGERIYRAGIADRQIAACAGCHSPNGVGIPKQYPRVAGQHGDYTQTQLQAFRAGERANSPQMIDVAARMNDREIKAVADYMAGLR